MEDLSSFVGDLEVFTGRDHEGIDEGLVGSDVPVAPVCSVLFEVDFHSQKLEAFDCSLADWGSVLADSASEDQGVESAHRRVTPWPLSYLRARLYWAEA